MTRNRNPLPRILALVLATGVGAYLILCGPGMPPKESPPAVQSANQPAAPRSCDELAAEIRQRQVFMSTSKAGPSAREIGNVEGLREEYRRRCPGR